MGTTKQTYHCNYLKSSVAYQYPNAGCKVTAFSKDTSKTDTVSVAYKMYIKSTKSTATLFKSEFDDVMETTSVVSALAAYGAVDSGVYNVAKSATTVTSGSCVTVDTISVCSSYRKNIGLGLLGMSL